MQSVHEALECGWFHPELLEAVKRLARSESQLEALCGAAPVGMALLDADFRFVRVNAAFADIDGMPVEAHGGRPIAEILPAWPLREIQAAWREVLETGVPSTAVEIAGETRAAPGRKRFWSGDWYRVRACGHTMGIGAVVREITSEKERYALQRVLMGMVGHDLRNPLSVITMVLHALIRSEELGPHLRSLALRAQRAAGHIERLASDLLDFTALQRDGTLAVAPEPVELPEVVRAVADEVQAAFPNVILDLAGPPGTGEWDPERVRQLVANLLSNAAKYGARGEPVAVRWSLEGGAAILTVTNRGEPIRPERLAGIFDGAVQAEPRRAHQGGIGLGLFIARAIARAHGGAIEARSDAECGTTFTVVLPLRPPRPA
jgi:PAS domain S-box-containing protein